MRKLFLVALAFLAARMAKRALARETGPYTQIMTTLWQLTWLLLAASTANTAKTRNVEDRLNLLVPRIPVPQTTPGTTAGGAGSGSNTSFGTSNGSFSMGGGTMVTSDTGSGNNGGTSSQTSGQIGGASAHVHSMTHYHVSHVDLQNIFNSLQGSYSNTVPALNALQGSYSSTIPALNALVTDHNRIVNDHNNLKAALKTAGVLQ